MSARTLRPLALAAVAALALSGCGGSDGADGDEQQLGLERIVLLRRGAARARAGDRPGADVAAVDRQQRLPGPLAGEFP